MLYPPKYMTRSWRELLLTLNLFLNDLQHWLVHGMDDHVGRSGEAVRKHRISELAMWLHDMYKGVLIGSRCHPARVTRCHARWLANFQTKYLRKYGVIVTFYNTYVCVWVIEPMWRSQSTFKHIFMGVTIVVDKTSSLINVFWNSKFERHLD